jgi:hypothetical protein
MGFALSFAAKRNAPFAQIGPESRMRYVTATLWKNLVSVVPNWDGLSAMEGQARSGGGDGRSDRRQSGKSRAQSGICTISISNKTLLWPGSMPPLCTYVPRLRAKFGVG